MTIFKKTANEIYDYGFNFAPKMEPGDVISASVWTVPSGLTAGAAGNNNTTTGIFLSGGTLGDDYACVNKITTAGGRVIERDFVVRIVPVRDTRAD